MSATPLTRPLPTDGLTMHVLHRADGYVSHGVASKAREVTVVGVVDTRKPETERLAWLAQDSRLHTADEQRPAMFLVIRHLLGRTLFHLVPADADTARTGGAGRYMAGSAFAVSSDSRLTRLYGEVYGALHIHDYTEQ